MTEYYKKLRFREAGANSYWQLQIFRKGAVTVVAFHTSKDRGYLLRLASERFYC